MSAQVKDHVASIAHDLANPDQIECEWEDGEPSAYEYLQDALDIQYLVTSKGEYIGARVLVAFGGPNIWINTFNQTVEGHWWNDSHTTNYVDNLGLDDALEDLWACTSI